jgi:hypothetical protein
MDREEVGLEGVVSHFGAYMNILKLSSVAIKAWGGGGG